MPGIKGIKGGSVFFSFPVYAFPDAMKHALAPWSVTVFGILSEEAG